jgi:hypothetical protein
MSMQEFLQAVFLAIVQARTPSQARQIAAAVDTPQKIQALAEKLSQAQ